MRTQPKPVPDASQYISKGRVISGWAKIGADVKSFLKVRKACSHLSFQLNFTPFLSNSVMGLAIFKNPELTAGNILLAQENSEFPEQM